MAGRRDSLANLMANAENVLGAVRAGVASDASQKAWAAGYDVQNVAKANSSRLDARTSAMLARFAELALNAVAISDQMASPQMWGDDRDLAEARIRDRLFKDVERQHGEIVRRFRVLRG